MFSLSNLENNNLGGALPEELSVFGSMEEFNVFRNSVFGPIPPVWSNWPSLRVFDLESNAFTGPAMPTEVLTMTNLESYRVSGNLLTGVIPHEGLEKLSLLRDFWVADNKIDGTLPSSIGSLTMLGESTGWSVIVLTRACSHVLFSLERRIDNCIQEQSYWTASA